MKPLYLAFPICSISPHFSLPLFSWKKNEILSSICHGNRANNISNLRSRSDALCDFALCGWNFGGGTVVVVRLREALPTTEKGITVVVVLVGSDNGGSRTSSSLRLRERGRCVGFEAHSFFFSSTVRVKASDK
ncbi:unnamed protein product [Vicia faba]|uniref:Uncharacterized protein n=1 Tax=Vicia faba TaxID=3906 RepID=A0AAV1A1K3_VICFA|nr:unnamed protein product [Vicia faba]